MPKKPKQCRKSNKPVERPLCLSDIYMFRNTYLNAELIDKLSRFTDVLLQNPLFAHATGSDAGVRTAHTRLVGNGFNNIYDYLEALLEALHSHAELVDGFHQLVQEHFPEPHCIKLVNLYTPTRLYDV